MTSHALAPPIILAMSIVRTKFASVIALQLILQLGARVRGSAGYTAHQFFVPSLSARGARFFGLIILR